MEHYKIHLSLCEIKREEDRDSLYTEVEHQNAVEVLIHTLTMHFVGNRAEELKSKKLLLTNLRYPTIGYLNGIKVFL